MNSIYVFLSFCFFVIQSQAGVTLNSKSLNIEFSGSNGHPGQNGEDSSLINLFNQTLRLGQSGGSGTDGKSLKIYLDYKDESKKSVVILTKVFSNPHYNTNPVAEISEIVPLNKLRNLTIHTQGGNGGNGGVGGKGSNGDSGGDGANGGNGGNAGSGGAIQIIVPEDASELFLLISKINNSPGTPGSGGEGGKGGKGSESSDGDNGKAGNQGSSGALGNVSFFIGEQEFKKPFSLKVVNVKYDDENQDGIVEHGEKINIRKLVIKNQGGMLSPEGFVIDGEEEGGVNWVISRSLRSFEIPSIKPGEEKSIEIEPGVLVFRATSSKVNEDLKGDLPLMIIKKHLQGKLESSFPLSIKRPVAMSVENNQVNSFWGQNKSFDLDLENRTQVELSGDNLSRNVKLRFLLDLKELQNTYIQLIHNNNEVLVNSNGEAELPLELLKAGKNKIKIHIKGSFDLQKFKDIKTKVLLIIDRLNTMNPEPKIISDIHLRLRFAKSMINEYLDIELNEIEGLKCVFSEDGEERTIKRLIIKKIKGSDKFYLLVWRRWLGFKSKSSPILRIDPHAAIELSTKLKQGIKIPKNELALYFYRYIIPVVNKLPPSEELNREWKMNYCRAED